MPYSSIYQPIPFTAFNLPGIRTGFPSLPKTFLPVIGFPSLLILPPSLMSKAIALALLVEVVLEELVAVVVIEMVVTDVLVVETVMVALVVDVTAVMVVREAEASLLLTPLKILVPIEMMGARAS